jgi:hypothetical protein
MKASVDRHESETPGVAYNPTAALRQNKGYRSTYDNDVISLTNACTSFDE